MATAFAGIDELCIMVDIIEDLGIQVKIIDNHLCLFQTLQAFYGQESDIAGTGTDQIDFTVHSTLPSGLAS
jgi:hypothetical protein